MAGSSQTELLSRVAVAEAELEELVLSTLAAFFAIASVECQRDEGRVQSLDTCPTWAFSYENNSSPLIPLEWEYRKLGS